MRGASMYKTWLVMFAAIGSFFSECKEAKYCVIGGGPAGVLAACKLIDLGICPKDITILDPDFAGGILGRDYQQVNFVSNNAWLAVYFTASSTLSACIPDYISLLLEHPIDLQRTDQAADALKQVVKCLKLQGVHCRESKALSIQGVPGRWKVVCHDREIHCDNLIIATGWSPKNLGYNPEKEVALPVALSRDLLPQVVASDDNVLLFGCGRSAHLVVRNLWSCGVRDITNVVIGLELPIQGVKAGFTYDEQQWLEAAINRATKIVYAVGFESILVPTDSDIITRTYSISFAEAVPADRLCVFAEQSQPGVFRIAVMDLVSIGYVVNELLPAWFKTQAIHS